MLLGMTFQYYLYYGTRIKKKNNSKFIPNLPNPWKENLGFNMSQNYAFFINSSHDWIHKNSFHSSDQLLKKLGENVGFNLRLNETSVLDLFKMLIIKNNSDKLFLINRFPYTLHYRRDNVLKYHSDEWTVLDSIQSTKILLNFCKQINISSQVICMVPSFKDVFFKRSMMFNNSIYNSTTDYISLTNFVSSFYKNKQFSFVKANDVIKLILGKEQFKEDELLSSIFNLRISGDNALETVFSKIIFPNTSSLMNKKNSINHKLKRNFQWLNEKNQHSRAPLSHSLNKNFVRILNFNKKYRFQYLSDISFNYADKGGLIRN